MGVAVEVLKEKRNFFVVVTTFLIFNFFSHNLNFLKRAVPVQGVFLVPMRVFSTNEACFST